MKHIFLIAHPPVPNLQHIKIVPRARLRFTDHRSGFVDDVHDRAVEARERALVGRARTAVVGAIEGIVDVAAHAPAVGDRTAPVPGGIFAPVAEGVEDCSAFFERAHSLDMFFFWFFLGGRGGR